MEAPKFSYYKWPITNVIPYGDVTLSQVYNALKRDKYSDKTHQCRELYKIHGKASKKVDGIETNEFRIYKAENLPSVTFGGRFTKRCKDSLIEASGYYCMDLDNLEDVDSIRDQILGIYDPYFITNLLFKSPSGCGLKWVITIDPVHEDYSKNYRGLCIYIQRIYGLNSDSTCDISRACFLCHDPEAYYNEQI